MRKTLTIGILLILAIFSLSFSASAIDSVEIGDMELFVSSGYGPGSEIPLMSPIESGYAWVYPSEPLKAVWTIYTPYYQPVYSISHRPSYKIQQSDGSWNFADKSAATIPAFAAKGDWLAKCDFHMADGSILTMVSVDQPNAIYIPYHVDRDDWFASFFTAPFVWFGLVGPSLIVFPGIFLWIPLGWIIFCAIWSRSIGGFVDMTKGAISAGRKAGVRLPRRKKKKGKK